MYTEGWAADMVRFLVVPSYEGLNVGDSRASSERVVAVLIPHPTVCSDFRVDVVVTHNRTGHPPKCHLNHVAAGVVVLD